MLKIPLCMISPDALSQSCSSATAIVYENIKTKENCAIYKEGMEAGGGSSEGVKTKWSESVDSALTTAVDYAHLIENLNKTISIKGSSYSSQRYGHHFIYILTNKVQLRSQRGLRRLKFIDNILPQ